MATGKRYYWIKLKTSFLTSETVQFLMSQDAGNGANYVVLYQMLCLITINTDGKLERQIGEVIIPYDVEKIRQDCKYFSADTIRVAMELYMKLGLIYRDDNGCLIIANHSDLIGSETDWAAKKRRQNLDKDFPDCLPEHGESGGEIFPTEYRDKSIDNRDKSIEIDTRKQNKDIASEILTEPDGSVCRTKDVRRITEAWNSLGLQQLTRVTGDSKRGGMLRSRIREYGVDGVLSAIEKVRESSFLKGQNSNSWEITFEWFVKPNNFVKVLEGNYDDKIAAATGNKQKTTTFIEINERRKQHDQ